jgi:hypothetical protein
MGVSLLCDVLRPSSGTHASWRRLGRVRPFGHTLDTGGVDA